MRICIVGAGVAGLQTADALCDTHECVVFDANDGVGGVWRKNYDGYALQVPAELYQFVDGEPSLSPGTFPYGPQVMEYIRAFVRTRNLRSRCTIRDDHTVVSIARREGKWSVEAEVGATKERSQDSFDYCVVCTGMYHVPNVPAAFSSTAACVVHSSRFVDASEAANKSVVVVGGGKSAIDCAVAAAKAKATSVRLISRDVHWPVPRKILGLVPFQWGTYSRLGHFLLPAHWNLSASERWWHDVFAAPKRLVWRALEAVFALQFDIPVRPRHPLVVDLFGGGQILTSELDHAVRSGHVERIVRDVDVEKDFEGVDLVVCGTGFAKDYSMFDAETQRLLAVDDDGLWLYNNVIPPDVPGLAFVGSEVSTFNNILTQWLQAQWLSKVALDSLPSVERMKEAIERDKHWKRSWMPKSASRASLVQLHMTKYHDTLAESTGWPRVKSKWYEWFFPITADDFRSRLLPK